MWTTRDGRPVPVPDPPPGGTWYRAIGDFQGVHHERNAFARGTEQEAAFLWRALGLRAGTRLLDVGCGTGRHLRVLAARGVRGVGIDISAGLLRAAAALGDAGYIQADAQRLPLPRGAVDAALSLCQGGFGLTLGTDERVVAELARVVRPGGRVAVTAYSLAFAARWAAPGDAFDLDRGAVWSAAEVRGPDGAARHFDLWTTCYSAPHLRSLLERAGLAVDALWGVEPGRYANTPLSLAHPEMLAVCTRR